MGISTPMAATAAGAQSRAGAKTLIEYAYKRLRRDIVCGYLKPGSKLRIEHLRSRYEVGGSTLREALTLLLADALVTAEGQRGFRVAPVSMEDLQDLTRMRKMLETSALRESIERGDDNWEAGVVAAFHRLSLIEERLPAETTEVAETWEERNRAFHEALTAGSTSRWTQHFRSILYYQSERYRRFCLMARDSDRDVRAEHKAIMEAALARDVDRACACLEEHIDKTLAQVVRLTELPAAAP